VVPGTSNECGWGAGDSGDVVGQAAAAAVAGCNSAADWSIKLRNLWALTVRARRSTVDWYTIRVFVCV